MKYDYQYKITFKLNEPFDINYIKNVCNQYPNSKILVEVQNTKGISSSMIKINNYSLYTTQKRQRWTRRIRNDIN